MTIRGFRRKLGRTVKPPSISVTIPAYNEERALAQSIRRLVDYLAGAGFPWTVVIAENGSTDRTLEVAEALPEQRGCIRVIHLDRKGRGGAIRRAWGESDAAVLCYMDVDLSTDLTAFPALVKPLLSGHFDLATGSRLRPESSTTRGWKRETLSRAYNLLLRVVFHTRFSDAQCGFKAITQQAARALLPLVRDDGWFFDTELMVVAERLGYRILDLPVRWVEDLDSRVKIPSTVIQDLKGVIRLRRALRSLDQSRATGVHRSGAG